MRFLSLLLLGLLFAPLASAQGTGTLAGRVTDAATGEGLPGANVGFVGTDLGAATDIDGNYRIIGIPVGAYDVTARYVGFQEETVSNVQISSGYTTQQDFGLSEGIELSEVVVEYERPIIQRDAIGAPRVAGAVPQGATDFGYAPRGGRDESWRYAPPVDREGYAPVEEVGFRRPLDAPLSTFSIDVDRASYANVRRMLGDGYLPPPDAVRIEEFVNYFDYDYAAPGRRASHPFAVHTEVAACPWAPGHRLVRIALQGARIETEDLPPNNLVFLIDVSGSMQDPDKLPLLKSAFRLLVEGLRPEDRVALVVYAGAAGLVLPPTSGRDQAAILQALDRLEAGGSTAGGAGLQLAYAVARQHFDRDANNRVILATDGDFNVGPSSDAEMQRLVEAQRESGVFLSVLGFGTGNLQDSKMEAMADHGNGNYSYIDSIREGHRVFVREMGGTLTAIAKDVKVQVEFNPARVAAYRLVGYENRMLRDEEFNDDTRDAGELGAGHRVTALYEVVPAGEESAEGTAPPGDPLRYQRGPRLTGPAESDELLAVKLRYKPATGPGRFADESRLLERTVRDGDHPAEAASEGFRWVAAVAEFGLLLRRSDYAGASSYDGVLALARAARGDDPHGDRAEFLHLVEVARALDREPVGEPEVSMRD